MRRLALVAFVALLLASCVCSQQAVFNGIGANVDFSGKTTTKPVKSGTSAPGTCAVGELFYDTDATAGVNLYGCTAVNTWTLLGDGDSGGDVSGGASLTTAGRMVSVASASTVTEEANVTVSGGVVTATGFSGPLTGAVTGNASTATTLADGDKGDVSASSGTISIDSGAVTTAKVATALKTGQITYSYFSVDTALPDGWDIPSIYPNRARAITLTEVYCECDAGTPSINLQRDDGSPADILSSNLTCTAGGATSTSFSGSEASIAAGYNIDHVTVSGSTAQRINVAIKYTVD